MNEKLIEYYARTCHELSRAVANSSKDFSAPTWDGLPLSYKNAYRAMVQVYKDGHQPRDLHSAFKAGMELAGFTYGEAIDQGADPPRDPVMNEWGKLSTVARVKFGAMWAFMAAPDPENLEEVVGQ